MLLCNLQMRRNGESFLSHCVETALILAATGVSSAVVAAGLLHDAIDDSNLSLNLLRGALGDDIANLVVGVCVHSTRLYICMVNQCEIYDYASIRFYLWTSICHCTYWLTFLMTGFKVE